MMAVLSTPAFAEEDLSGFEPPENLPVVLGFNNFSELVIDPATNAPISDKGWFVKFYAPWCGHCKRLTPTWNELFQNNRDRLNVGKVDCTSDDGKGLCSHYDIRGYPTLIYFPAVGAPKPTKTDENGNTIELDAGYFRFEGARTLEGLEDFALNGGYLNSENGQQIPKRLTGPAYWLNQLAVAFEDMKAEVDTIFIQLSLDRFVPRPFRYLIVLSLFFSPIIVLVSMLCCCFEDEPQPTAHVHESHEKPVRAKID